MILWKLAVTAAVACGWVAAVNAGRRLKLPPAVFVPLVAAVSLFEGAAVAFVWSTP